MCCTALQYVNMWLTLSGEESLPEMYFHCDNHAFKFVKVFVFLSDVDLDGGHHEFVKNTHTVKSFKSILFFSSQISSITCSRMDT